MAYHGTKVELLEHELYNLHLNFSFFVAFRNNTHSSNSSISSLFKNCVEMSISEWCRKKSARDKKNVKRLYEIMCVTQGEPVVADYDFFLVMSSGYKHKVHISINYIKLCRLQHIYRTWNSLILLIQVT